MPSGTPEQNPSPGDARPGDQQENYQQQSRISAGVATGPQPNVPETYGENSQYVKTYRFDEHKIGKKNLNGSAMYVVSASSSDASVTLKLQGDKNAEITLSPSDAVSGIRGFRGQAFTDVEVTDKPSTGEFVEVLVYTEAVPQGFEPVFPVEQVSQVQVTTPKSGNTKADVTCADGATTQVFDISTDADSQVENIFISNPGGSAGTIRVGYSTNVGASRGDIVEPGETLSRDVADDVYVHNPQASSIDVAVSWTET